MQNIRLAKYVDSIHSVSYLNHLDDALDLIEFLTSTDFIKSQLVKCHGKPAGEAKALAKRIGSHARLASKYARLSLVSPPEISFLPGYYAILNLAKIYALAGKYSGEFDQHSKWHGAYYSGIKKSSHQLLTEELSISAGGVLALLYKTLTDVPIAAKRVVKLKDFYSLVPGIGSELEIVTETRPMALKLAFRAEISGGLVTVEAQVAEYSGGSYAPYTGSVRLVPCLKGFTKKAGTINVFVKSGAAKPGATLESAAHSLIRPEFLSYQGAPMNGEYCFQQKPAFPLTEELAAALVFFHMSSVCRYNPEFLEKLCSSTAWPMLLQARRHTLYMFLMNTFSYITKANYYLE